MMREGHGLIEVLKTVKYSDIASAGSHSWLRIPWLEARYSCPPLDLSFLRLLDEAPLGVISWPSPLDNPCRS